MWALGAAPLLLSIVLGMLLGVVAWSIVRIRAAEKNNIGSTWDDDLLIGLLVVGALASGVFLTYALLHLAP